MKFRKKTINNKKQINDNLFKFIKNINWYKVIISVTTIAVISLVCVYFNIPNNVDWRVGTVATKTIVAKSVVSFRDYKSEKYIRDQIINKEIAYQRVPDALSQTISDINLLFSSISSERNSKTITQNEINQLRIKIYPYVSNDLSDGTLYSLLTISDTELQKVKDATIVTVSYVLAKDLKEDKYYMQEAYENSLNILIKRYRNENIRKLSYNIIVNILKPNLIYSETKTREAKEEKQKEIPLIYRTLNPGEVIIAKGDVVTEYNLELLKAAGFHKNKSVKIENIIGIVGIVIFAFVFILTYIKRYSNIIDNINNLLLLSIIIIVCMLGFWVSGSMLMNTFDNYKLGYVAILWVISASMLIYALLSKYLSTFVLVFLSILIGYSLGNDIRIVALSIITGMCALWSVSKLNARNEFINMFLIIALVTFLQVLFFGLIYAEQFYYLFTEQIKYAVFTIPIATFVFFILSSVFEKLFDRTTHMRLIELSDTNNKLLKMLALEAPGTYAHSVSVSYIAESAAERIDANSLLARVGAYYHDIGKLNNPQYFSENQYAENVHDDMTPTLSTMVIQSHVKLGVEYAEQHKLPSSIIDIIQEHHGTCLVSYFFHQYSENNSSLVNMESQFRYPGPKPQSKEAAIVMIADSIEAASRSLKAPTPNKIETMVNSIVSNKLGDGQFNECPLTLGDISIIKISCIKTLMHIMHTRIEYPDVTPKESKEEIKSINSEENGNN